MRGIICIIFFFWIPNCCLSQQLTGLISAYFSESLMDNGTWVTRGKTFYTYDPKGQLTYGRGETWIQDLQIWQTQYEEYLKYDQWGNTSYELRRRYTPDTNKWLMEEDEITSVYKDSLLIERRQKSKHLYDLESVKLCIYRINEYHTYFPDGTKNQYKLEEHYDNCYPGYHFQTIQYQEGCMLWETVESSGVYKKGVPYKDSIAYSFLNTANYTCLPKKKDQYEIALNNGQANRIISEEWEYEFENGLMTKERKLVEKDPGIYYPVNYTISYQYDNQGRLIEQIDSSFWDELYVSRYMAEYEELEEGILRRSIYQEWDSATSTWIPRHKDENLSSDLEEIYFAYHNIWNQERQDFNENYEQQLLPDVSDTLKRYTGRAWGYDAYRDVEYDNTYLTWVRYRCDGFEIESGNRLTDGNLNNSYGMENYIGNRNIYEYYDIPECENLNNSGQLVLFPVPASDYMNILLDGSIPSAKLWILDSNGRLVQDQNIGKTNYLSIDVSLLRPGVYILNLDTGDQLYTEKLVISR